MSKTFKEKDGNLTVTENKITTEDSKVGFYAFGKHIPCVGTWVMNAYTPGSSFNGMTKTNFTINGYVTLSNVTMSFSSVRFAYGFIYLNNQTSFNGFSKGDLFVISGGEDANNTELANKLCELATKQ